MSTNSSIGTTELLPFGNANRVGCSRTSAANLQAVGNLTNSPTSSVAAYQPRLETVLATTTATTEMLRQHWQPFGIDLVRGVILGINNNSGNLETVPVANPTGTATVVGSPTAIAGKNYCNGFFCAADGSWTGFFHDNNSDTSVVKRTTDAGATWTTTLTSTPGPADACTVRQRGNEITWGGYPIYNNLSTTNPPIYYSADCGATWSLIYTVTSPNDGSNFHVHAVEFDLATTSVVRIFMGDSGAYPFRWIFKLSKPNGWVPGNSWSLVATIPNVGGEGVCTTPYGILQTLNTLNWNGGANDNPNITLLDPSNDTFSIVSGFGKQTQRMRNVWYDPASGLSIAPMYNYGAPGPGVDTGLYITKDFSTFSTLSRLPGTYQGFHAITGVAGGYLWMDVSDASETPWLARIAMPTTQQVQALRIEPAKTNVLNTSDDCSFTASNGTPSIGGWIAESYGSCAAVAASSVPGTPFGTVGNVAQLTTDGAGIAEHGVRFESKSYAQLGYATPLVGDYVLIAAPICTTDSPYNAFYISDFETQSDGDWSVVFQNMRSIGRKPSWVLSLVKYTGTPLSSGHIQLRIKLEGNGANPGVCHFYVGPVSWFTGPDPSMLYQSWQNQVAATSESSQLSLAGLGTAWTMACDWIKDFDANLCVGDKPIATITGQNGAAITLTWNAVANTITMSDGTHSVATAAFPVSFRSDIMRIAVTHNGTNAILYTQDPLNGTVAVGAASGVVMAGSPVNLLLGTNAAGTTHGRGLFFNAHAWGEVFSSGQVASLWTAAGSGFDTFAFPTVANVLLNVNRGDGLLGTDPGYAAGQAAGGGLGKLGGMGLGI